MKVLGYLEILLMTSLKHFDKLLESLIQSHSIRLNITGNQECLLLAKENQKLRGNDKNEQKFRNIKTSFLTEVKRFKNEFFQSCIKHTLGE